MELYKATEKARQILDEERASPTVKYSRVIPEVRNLGEALTTMAGMVNLHQMRAQRPREIVQDPTWYRFESVNYNLLCALLSQLNEKDRSNFVGSVGLQIVSEAGCARSNSPVYPKWSGLVSELPLVGEFMVRNGGKAQLFRTLGEVTFIPGHALLLSQLEDMIALNYSILTDSDYEYLSAVMSNIKWRAETQAEDYKKRRVTDVQWPGVGCLSATGLCYEIEKAAAGIMEQCRKARYLYLRSSLSEGLNLEVNQDKTAVETYLQRFGFPQTLVECLNQAERQYQFEASPFNLKSSMGHLRSFLENVHKEAMPALNAKFGGPMPQKWGEGLAYLVRNELLSKAEEQLAAGLYTLMSDEGVHPTIAEREYVRLARNMVIEYALLFLRKVDKLGVKSLAVAASQPRG